eukprot:TRINITY_DN742_c0_g1_i1.p1 TRINITY_DN742_c0_g1~~TRINITY_DN742_c0_g1_i1.p1  ORF type:complete len:393 (+),score=138.73 TRINITY_DN742_c0_g1_i1:164-1180(+)
MAAIEAEEKPVVFEGKQDADNIAGVMKRFFRYLPDPLLTYALQPEFFSVIGETRDKEGRVEAVRGLVRRLPWNHRATAQAACRFFATLASHPKAKMNSRNLAIIFGPHFLRTKSIEQFKGASIAQFEITALMIDHYNEIFHDVEVERARKRSLVRSSSSFAIRRTSDAGLPTASDLIAFEKLSPKAETGMLLSLGEIVKQGYLSRKGRGTWQQRWFVLKKNYLYSFKNPKDRTPSKVVVLAGAQVKADAGNKREHVLIVVDDGGGLHPLAARTHDDLAAWLHAIASCCGPSPAFAATTTAAAATTSAAAAGTAAATMGSGVGGVASGVRTPVSASSTS